jgi:hypothetical protein
MQWMLRIVTGAVKRNRARGAGAKLRRNVDAPWFPL